MLIFNTSPHIEPAWGTPQDNIIYCSKDGKFIQAGDKPSQGARTDLKLLGDQLIKGEQTIDNILIENPILYHQYGRTLEKIADLSLKNKKRTKQTKGIWIHGKTGTGKSLKAFEMAGEDHYLFPYDDEWHDDYKHQKTVIIDDFRGQIQYSQLLRMVDIHNNCKLRRRNKSPLYFTSETVIITSALPPHEVYNNLSQNDKLDQLLRRFEIIEL